jgi:hypothetical protein
MTLRLVRVDPVSVAAVWSIETPTPGVVFIDVALDGDAPPAPLHWRASTGAKPPLDLSLDGGGRLVGFQFVLQDERVPSGEWSVLPDPENGVPLFDVSEWPSDRYRDEIVPVSASRLSGGELTLRLGEARAPTHACQVGAGLVMAFNEDNSLAEIRLGPLDDEDWDAIAAFSFVE